MVNPIRILVVDDNEDLLNTFSLVLKRNGFYVETATGWLDGRGALLSWRI